MISLIKQTAGIVKWIWQQCNASKDWLRFAVGIRCIVVQKLVLFTCILSLGAGVLLLLSSYLNTMALTSSMHIVYCSLIDRIDIYIILTLLAKDAAKRRSYSNFCSLAHRAYCILFKLKSLATTPLQVAAQGLITWLTRTLQSSKKVRPADVKKNGLGNLLPFRLGCWCDFTVIWCTIMGIFWILIIQ